MFCYCRLQELKVHEQFWVHMNGILRNWKILPAPSEKNLPLLAHFVANNKYFVCLTVRFLGLSRNLGDQKSSFPIQNGSIKLEGGSRVVDL